MMPWMAVGDFDASGIESSQRAKDLRRAWIFGVGAAVYGISDSINTPLPVRPNARKRCAATTYTRGLELATSVLLGLVRCVHGPGPFTEAGHTLHALRNVPWAPGTPLYRGSPPVASR